MAQHHAVFALPFNNKDILRISTDEEHLITSVFQPACLPFQYAWGGTYFYGRHVDDSIMIMEYKDDDLNMSYASGSQKHYAELHDLLEGIGELI